MRTKFSLFVFASVVLFAGAWTDLCKPKPEPTPSPTISPTPTVEPTPIPTPIPTPLPTPTSTPPTTEVVCPKPLAPGAYVYVNDKPYGNGFDSSYRVHGDTEFCRRVNGVASNDCSLEGWPKRVQCELKLAGGCPIWQYQSGSSIYPCHDDQSAIASCDHFGDPTYRDDPKTKTTGDTIDTLMGFEGMPKECGLQRDFYGPMAGFFTVAHGIGNVRACLPDGTNCGPWKHFNH
jgi:hypothetical protein